MQWNQPGARHTRKRSAVLGIIFVSLFAMCCYGLNPTKNLRQYVLRTWTSEQGLPQNSIRAILQTRDGFLWVGTRGGLARFDGAAFVLYKAGPANSIPNDSITGLAEDRDGTLWISSAGGLTTYRDGHFHTYARRDGLPGTSIWRLAADPDGGVWAVTRRSTLFHFDGKQVARFASPTAAPPEDVNALLEDSNHTLWMATFHGLFAFDRKYGFRRFTRAANGIAGDRMYALALDRKGGLWAAGDGGLTHHIAGNRFRVRAIHGLPTATLLAFDPSGPDDGIWTGSTGGGLFRLGAAGVQRLNAAQALTRDEIWLLYFSRDGSLWLGAMNGLNQMSDGIVTSYRHDEVLPRSTLDIERAIGPNGELWFGHGSFLFRVRDGNLERLGPITANAKSVVHDMAAVPLRVRSDDRRMRGLVLTDGRGDGVLTDGTVTRPLPRIPWASVGTMLIDRSGTIWVGGSQDGVLAYGPHGHPRAYTTANGLDDNNVQALGEDTAGNIWVGTISGLNRIRHGIVTRVVSSASLTSIDPCPDGSVWASSESGLIYVPPSRKPPRIFTQRDHLPTSIIEGVADDGRGYLWLGTEQGIVRVSKSALLGLRGQRYVNPVVFGTEDGFRSAQVRPNSASRSRDGDIWLITLKELAKISTRGLPTRRLAPVVVDQIDIDDHQGALAPVSTLTVPAGRHRLTIHYTLPEFAIPGRIRFRYRLEGWDKQWIDAGVLRDAVYTGIPPGAYNFLVVHSDGYGKWSPAESVLPIRVEPFFYQTGWFWTLVTLLVIACIWQLHKRRVAQVSAHIKALMQERMHERTRIARELHDTLLQGMLGVSMQLYAASQQASPSTGVSSTLGDASQRLREIAEQGRNAVDGLRASAVTPDALETRLACLFQEMSLPVHLQPEIHSVGAHRILLPPIQGEIEQIVRQAISNAVQHAGANMIRLDVLYQPAHFFLSVSDDGCGIDQETQKLGRPGHWGITGMQERAKSIGARLRILSNAPSGTVVEVSLQGTVAYLDRPHRHPGSIWPRRLRR